MEHRTIFYATAQGHHSARDQDQWALIEDDDGALEVEHRWLRPRADGLMLTTSGARRLSVESFLRDEGSDTAKRRLRRLLGTRRTAAPD